MPPRKYKDWEITDEEVDYVILEALISIAEQLKRNRDRMMGVVVFDLGNETPTPDVSEHDGFVEGE